MTTNTEMVAQFFRLLQNDPDTAALAAMTAGPVSSGMAGTPDQIVMTLDKLARMWANAKEQPHVQWT